MEGKKRYIAIILFLLICLMLFTFAATGEEELESGKGNGSDIKEVTNKDDSNKDKDDNTSESGKDSNSQNSGSTGTSNNGSSNAGDSEDLDGTGNTDNSAWDNALAAVEELEKLLTDDQLNAARELVEQITNSEQYKELIERVEDAEDAMDATALVEALEKMVEEAAKKEDIEDASDYRDEEVIDAVNEIDGEFLEDVKEELLKRIEELNKILDDNTAPTVEGIEDGSNTNKDVELTITDDNKVTTTVTKDGETYEEVEKFTEEGTYEITVVDSAFNETKLTFTIDKTSPKITNLKNGSHYSSIEKIEVEDATETTVTIKNQDTGKEVEVPLTEDATYYITVTDAAGNSKSIYVAIDNTYPEITGIDETKPTNKNEIVYVSDKFLTKVIIDGKEYTRSDFEVGDKNENFKFQKKITHEGTHTVVAIDKFGNETTKTFVIDKTAAKVKSSDFYVHGLTAVEKVFYTQKDNKITVNVKVNEQLANVPTFTLHSNGKDYALTDVLDRGENAPGVWLYQASYVIDEDMADGEVTFTISNIVDLAGNVTDNVTAPTNGRRVIVDNTAPIYDNLALVGGKGYWFDKEYKQFATNNTIVYVNVRFKEKLATTPVVTLNDIVTLTKPGTVKEVNGVWIYSYSYRLTEGDGIADGTLQVKVTNIADLAGNSIELTNADCKMESQSEIIVDRHIPEIVLPGVQGLNTNELRIESGSELKLEDVIATVNDGQESTITLNPYKADLLIGKKEENTYNYDFSNGFDTRHIGRYNIYYEYTDLAGNKATATLLVFMKDTTPATITLPGTEGRNKNEYRVESGTEVTLEDVLATVTDNVDEESKLEPYKADLLIGGKEENIYNYDFSNGFDTRYIGRYNIYYTYTDKAGHVTNATMLLVMTDTTPATITIPGTEGLNKNEYRVEAGTEVTLEDVLATVTDNVDEESKLEPYKADLLISNKKEENIYNYDFSNGFDTNYHGRYNLSYTYTDKAGHVTNASMMIVMTDTVAPTLEITEKGNMVYVRGKDVTRLKYTITKDGKTVHTVDSETCGCGNYFSITWLAKTYGDGEYTIDVVDAGGNKATAKAIVDTTAPEVLEYTQKYDANENGVKVTVTFNEAIKSIDEGWSKVEGKENTYSKVYNETKEYTVNFKDLVGNKNTYTFAVDATPNRVTQTFYRGDKIIDKTFYVKNGDKIQFNIGFSEKLSEDAVITIGGKKVELTYERYFEATKSHMYYGYLEVAEDETELVEGELEISISNITDEVGNPGFYYQTNGKKVMASYKNVLTTNGHKVVYDNTANRVTQTFFRGDVTEGKMNYVTNGSKIQFNIGFSEKLSEDMVITIGGKEVEMTYEKYVVATKSHMYYGYLEVTEEDNFEEGILEIKISNITDFVGNKGFYYQTNGKKVYQELTQDKCTNAEQVFYDVTGPEVTPSYTETTTEQDEEFTNFPTFEVKDNSNQSVTEELISGSVDTTKLGCYKLTYRFTDIVGNYTDVTVTVKVVDTTAPVISGITDGAYYNTKDTHAIPSAYDKNGAVMFIRTELGDLKLTSFLKNEKEIKLVGTYKVWAVDAFGNKSEEITIHIDPYAPKVLVLDRIENVSGAYLPIKPVILEHNLDTITVTLNGKTIDFKEGDQLTKDGKYVMTVTDKANNSTTVEFTMDSVAPTMMVSPTSLGVVDSLDLNDDDNITGLLLSEDADFQLMKAEKNITVLGKDIPIYKYTKLPENGIIDEEGQYIIIAYDKAYNVTAYKFIVDRSAPTVNVEEGKYYSSVTVNVEDANMASGSLEELKDLIPGLGSIISSISKLDPSITIKEENDLLKTTIENGYVVDEDGTYTLTAKDVIGVNPLFSKEEKAAHTTTVTFHIDTKKPTANVVEGGVYKSVTVAVEDAHLDEESITINGKKYDGKEITEEGNYVLEAKDLAGNTLTVNFEVDKTPITISGAKEFNNSSVEIKVESKDENPTIELNGVEVEKEFTASKEGENEVVVVDKWGNKETVTFVIDTIKPVINNPTALPEQNTTVGAVKNTSINVVASVTDTNATKVEILPTVSHSKHGDMGKLSTIATDKANVGTYTLTYDTVDKAGNAAEQLVLTVEVVVDDYVLSFNDIKTTYNYGETIPALTFADLTLVSDEENITLVDGDITFDVNTNTMKNAGTYTVKATLNKTIDSKEVVRTATITFEVKPIKATVSFIKNNGFGAVNAETGLFEYEFDGNSNPFSATVEGILDADKETVKVTVNYDKEVFGVKTYKAIATLNSDNYYLENNTYNFEIKKANATVKLPTLATGNVEVKNADGLDITEYASTIISQEKSISGIQKDIFDGIELVKVGEEEKCLPSWLGGGCTITPKYESVKKYADYNVSIKYQTIQVVSNEYMEVPNTEGKINGDQYIKTASQIASALGVTIVEEVYTQVKAEMPKTGTAAVYITEVPSVEKVTE